MRLEVKYGENYKREVSENVLKFLEPVSEIEYVSDFNNTDGKLFVKVINRAFSYWNHREDELREIFYEDVYYVLDFWTELKTTIYYSAGDDKLEIVEVA